jgi:hypothetical protein
MNGNEIVHGVESPGHFLVKPWVAAIFDDQPIAIAWGYKYRFTTMSFSLNLKTQNGLWKIFWYSYAEKVSILSLDTFLLWIFIELNSLSTFENWWKTPKMLAVNVLRNLDSQKIYQLDFEALISVWSKSKRLQNWTSPEWPSHMT